MYVSPMVPVRGILVLLVPIALLAACSSGRTVEMENRPAMQLPEENPVDEGEREAPLPRGFVGDSDHVILHRADCPRVADCDPSDRVFFVTPWPALNEGYVPCEYCEPLEGWR